METIPQGSKAIKQLSAAGIIPPECTRFELLAEVNKAVRLRYEVFASEEQVQQIADVLERNPEEALEMARSFVFKSKTSDLTVFVELP